MRETTESQKKKLEAVKVELAKAEVRDYRRSRLSDGLGHIRSSQS